MSRSRAFITLVFFICGLASVSGCSSRKAALTGKVTFNGKPLAMGTVNVVGADGIAIPTVIGEDGSYRVEGVIVGIAKIGVSSPKPPTPEEATRI